MFIGSPTNQPASSPLPINGCGAHPIMYLPVWGASRCRHPTPRGAVGDRVDVKPFNPGHRPAPHAPSMLVNPSSPARRAWHALRPPLCCSPPGMKMGSDSPGQIMPFPYKPRSGRVMNGDAPELSSGKEIRRRGCNQPSTGSPRRHKAKDHGTREEGKFSTTGARKQKWIEII